jgi:hypothetical protein
MQKYGKKIMVWPDVVPVFTVDDIIEPPATEYEEGDKKSMVGWLKHLFLYYTCPDDPDCVQIRQEDRKDYKKVLDMVRKECTIGIKTSVEEWEETASRKKQAAVLNVVRKKLGYVDEFYKERIL